MITSTEETIMEELPNPNKIEIKDQIEVPPQSNVPPPPSNVPPPPSDVPPPPSDVPPPPPPLSNFPPPPPQSNISPPPSNVPPPAPSNVPPPAPSNVPPPPAPPPPLPSLTSNFLSNFEKATNYNSHIFSQPKEIKQNISNPRDSLMKEINKGSVALRHVKIEKKIESKKSTNSFMNNQKVSAILDFVKIVQEESMSESENEENEDGWE